MQTSVIGFPRIGTLRELKFASEKYFRGEISSQELLDTAKNLRKIHWTIQKNEGIDFIPSNDTPTGVLAVAEAPSVSMQNISSVSRAAPVRFKAVVMFLSFLPQLRHGETEYIMLHKVLICQY